MHGGGEIGEEAVGEDVLRDGDEERAAERKGEVDDAGSRGDVVEIEHGLRRY